MKSIFIATFFILSFSIYSNEKPLDHNFKFKIENYKYTFKDNFKNIEMPDFKQKDNLGKLILATGIVSFAIGTPMLIAGLINYFAPLTDKTDLGNTLSFVLIGIGSGIITAGAGLTVAGSILFSIGSKEKKKEVSFRFELSPSLPAL